MLWFSVYLPELSLQSHARGAMGWLQSVPVIISDGVASRPYVHAANTIALDAGITSGMPVIAAQARAANLLVVPRQTDKEQDALRHLADWLLQFSPMVCIESAGASLEISSTLRLFGGLTQLTTLIRSGMDELGFQACAGIAPTPLAAWLLARSSQPAKISSGQARPDAQARLNVQTRLNAQTRLKPCREPSALPEKLGDISLHLFDWPKEINQPLSELGLSRIKDLLSQPRGGLRRRLHPQVLHDLDRALGKIGDPREPHCAPQTFSCDTDLLFDISDAERLFIPIRMLLNGMEGFMRARGAGASEIVLDLKHNRTFKTSHKFGSRHPVRNAEDWLRLIRDRLTANPFPEAVIALKLSAGQLLPYQEQNESWLPGSEARQEKWRNLIERVVSRLGDKSVFAVHENSDHRPEMAWVDGKPSGAKPAKNSAAFSTRPRPLLLLREPLALVTVEGSPQHHGTLALLAGPERIDTGWWDGKMVARDYYVASNPEKEICWVFRDYRHGKKWYLHGYFS
ncbi:MAG: DNA polymerase Y family protein [Betaproteobacteria bacterium]